MAAKYWRLTLKGEKSVDDVQSAVGKRGGMLVRIHVENGETQVYFAAMKTVAAEVSKGFGAAAPKEIALEDALKLV